MLYYNIFRKSFILILFIVIISIGFFNSSVSYCQQNLNDEGIVRQLNAYIEKLDRSGDFYGSVLLAKDGKVLYKKACGLASKRFNVPNKTDTKFNLGSMNKMFTGVAIAQLVEKGKLSYEDLLGKYLGRDWITSETAEKVKIKHLLCHTSGLGSYFNEQYMNSSKKLFRAVDDFKVLVADDRPKFEPGTSWSYSNTGMFLLGAVIEKVTEISYHDYIRQNVTGPAGMVNTDTYEMDEPVPNLAIGYHREGNKWKNNLYDHVIKGGPAGGGFSTVEDLLKFDVSLRSGKLISRESFDLITSAKPELNSSGYGYGFRIRNSGNNRIVGHSGGFLGINSYLSMFLDSGYTVAVMSNITLGARQVYNKIMELLGAEK